MTSHLYAIRGRAETSGREEDLHSIRAARRGVSGINGLVSDLLDVARIDTGLFTLEREPVDLTALARATAESLSTDEHEIIVHGADAVSALGDPRRIGQCLSNLLTNAVDHSPSRAPVKVFVSHTSLDGEKLAQLEIEDEGPGIPEELLPHIFERFNTARKEAGGLGIGLYLAKQIALAHGGDLAVVHDTGTRFVITLPALAPSADEAEPDR